MAEGVRPPHERLRDNAKLFAERNAEYGANYKNWGAAMAAMYPSGLTVRTPQEWLRLCLQVVRVMKETRYASNFVRGGHEDSMDDLSVYAAMAAEVDEVDRRSQSRPLENSYTVSEFASYTAPAIGEVRPDAQGVMHRWSVDSRGNGEWRPNHEETRAGPPTPRAVPEPATAVVPPHSVPIEQLREQLGPVVAVLGTGSA